MDDWTQFFDVDYNEHGTETMLIVNTAAWTPAQLTGVKTRITNLYEIFGQSLNVPSPTLNGIMLNNWGKVTLQLSLPPLNDDGLPSFFHKVNEYTNLNNLFSDLYFFCRHHDYTWDDWASWTDDQTLDLQIRNMAMSKVMTALVKAYFGSTRFKQFIEAEL